MKQVAITSAGQASLARKHPWIFSGALRRLPSGLSAGEVVQVCDQQGLVLACGHYESGTSIAVRVLRFDDGQIDAGFWQDALSRALAVRRIVTNNSSSPTDCYRLVHGEGDDLPGLIIDIYRSAAVIQCHSTGMYLARYDISAALQQVFGTGLDTIYCKSKSSLPQSGSDEFLLGSATGGLVAEHGISMRVNWVEGQKTGFFLDQRENRALLARYAAGRTVLDTFCNTGGFTLHALHTGAVQVVSVDVSQRALDLVQENVALMEQTGGRHEAICADVMHYLKSCDTFDILVVDPPAFAKNMSKKHNAVQAYKRLNALAIGKVAPGGLLFTFSCSQVVDEQLFYHTIVAAALETNRTVRVLHKLTQGPDHPVSIYHKEGAYLKGLVLSIS